MRVSGSIAILICCTMPPVARGAQHPTATAPAVAATTDPLVIAVSLLDGDRVMGVARALAPAIVVQVAEETRTIAWEDVLRIEPQQDERSLSEAAVEPYRLELSDGSAFSVALGDATSDGVSIRFRKRHRGVVPAEIISTMVRADSAAPVRNQLNELRDKRDRDGAARDAVVIARAGKALVLRGVVESIGAERVRFVWNGRERALPWKRVGGIVMASPQRRGSRALVTLRNQDRFAGSLEVDGLERLIVRSSIFESLSIPWSEIAHIDVRSDRLVFLSDLKPLRYEHEPLFGVRWRYTTDESLTGAPLVLDGQAYAKGIVMHSASRLTYRLERQAGKLAGKAGILDEVGPGRGNVTMRILGDDEVLWEGENIRGGDPPRDFIVDVSRVRELTLTVEYGDDLDLADHACWAFVRVIQ